LATRLFVGSLPWSVNDSSLEETFAEYGTVVSAKVIMDRITGKSRGFGFVEMSTPDEASAAINALNNTEVKGRTIVVNEAKARD